MEFPSKLIEKLKSAKKILFFTGAGISAESGIDTFRGKGGMWNRMKPQELASFDGFMRNPNLVWEWYQYRRKILKGTGPNPGHFAIAEFEGMTLTECVKNAYDEIKDRKGFLSVDGVFIKEKM